MKKSILYILLALSITAGVFSSLWMRERLKDANYSKKLVVDNERQLRLQDSTAFAHYRYETKTQMEQYLESQQQLTNTITNLGYKIKDIQSIVISQTKILDSISRSEDATTLVKHIRENKDTTAVFKFSAPCLETEFSITYSNDSLTASQDFYNIHHSDTIIGGMFKDRKMFLGINWSFLPFYKKKAKVTNLSECGETKTIIIDKKL